MGYCPFCAQRLATRTVFCHDCGRRLPASIPNFKPSRGWRFFAARSNIRDGSSTDAGIVGKAMPGEQLEFAEERGEWYLLVCGDSDGARYIHRSAARKLAAE